MKKVLILTLIVCFAVSLGAAAIPLTAASAAEASADPLDAAFDEAFLTFAGENYGGPLDTEIIRTPLYDIGLNALGALYSFSLYGEEGYAAVVESGRGGYEVAEMFFSGEQPYPFLPGDMNVFVRPLVYLVYNGGNYYTADTREAVDAETVAALAENAYFGSDSVLNVTSQTVSYVDKTDNEYTLAARFPNIVEVAGYSYACACIAGANIIQYYDRYSANLIAGYTPGMAIGPRYMYSLPGSARRTALYRHGHRPLRAGHHGPAVQDGTQHLRHARRVLGHIYFVHERDFAELFRGKEPAGSRTPDSVVHVRH